MRRTFQSLAITGLLIGLALLALTVFGVPIRFFSGLQGAQALGLFDPDELLQVPIVMAAGAGAGVLAMWLYGSDHRFAWVAGFALLLAIVCALAVPVSALALSRVDAWTYRLSVAFFCALAVAVASALTALARSR